MARMPRVVAVGLPHHITQRGNQRRDIFVTEAFCRVYLGLLKRHAEYHQLRILAYCLMTNHLHLVAIPDTEPALGRTLRHVHGRFAQYWNTEAKTMGHMWQNRYYSCPMEPARVWSVIRYVELNPVRAGLVDHALDYTWSSALAHSTGDDPGALLDLDWWIQNWTEGDWGQALRVGGINSPVDEIRRATYTGRPFGSTGFVEGLEQRLGRRLAPQAGGRPRKEPLRQMTQVS
jgi:putative transposase